MKDSQHLRAGSQAERERWLRTLAIDGREEVLFEFELLLRGLERYFHLQNLPVEDPGAVLGRDFRPELDVVRDAVNRAAHLTRLLLDRPSDRTLVFRRFVESQLADDQVRGRLLEEGFSQNTPQESLFLLRQGFLALRGVAEALLQADAVPYQVFADVGQLTVRDIALSRYFRPFRALEFRAEHDRIKSVRVLDVLRGIDQEELRRAMSLAFLGLFRLLHYLRYVTAPGSRTPVPRGQLVLALVKSEATSLSWYLAGELASRLSAVSQEASAVAARVALELRKDTGKVIRRDIPRAAADPAVLLRARDALETRVKQAVIPLARVFDRTIRGAAIFDEYVTRREQSRRVQLDLTVFKEMCGLCAEALGRGDDSALFKLRLFLGYFRDVSYQLLRFGDYAPFDSFIDFMVHAEMPVNPETQDHLASICTDFARTVESTLTQVNRREELAGRPPDPVLVQELIGRFWW